MHNGIRFDAVPSLYILVTICDGLLVSLAIATRLFLLGVHTFYQ